MRKRMYYPLPLAAVALAAVIGLRGPHSPVARDLGGESAQRSRERSDYVRAITGYTPENLKAGVLKSKGLITGSTFIADSRLGFVTDVVRMPARDGRPAGFAVVGNLGVTYANPDGLVQSFTAFEDRCSDVRALDDCGGSLLGFVDRGNTKSAKLIGLNGRTLWQWPSRRKDSDDMAWGDLNGDGRIEFVVAKRSWDGTLTMLDQSGKALWHRVDEVSKRECRLGSQHLEMLPQPGGYGLAILHADASGKIIVRDAEGIRQSALKMPEQAFDSVLVQWPNTSGAPRIVSPGKKKLYISDTSGRTLAKLDAPGTEVLSYIKGVPVRLWSAKPPCLAVLSVESVRSNHLLLYNSGGRLIYHERLPLWSEAIEAIPSGKSVQRHSSWAGRARSGSTEHQGSADPFRMAHPTRKLSRRPQWQS